MITVWCQNTDNTSRYVDLSLKSVSALHPQKVQADLEGLKKDLSSLTQKSEEVLVSPQQSSSAPMLRSELDATLKKMTHVYGLSSLYLDR